MFWKLLLCLLAGYPYLCLAFVVQFTLLEITTIFRHIYASLNGTDIPLVGADVQNLYSQGVHRNTVIALISAEQWKFMANGNLRTALKQCENTHENVHK